MELNFRSVRQILFYVHAVYARKLHRFPKMVGISYFYIISYHIISYHIISYHIISYHIISYHIISYHIIYHIISYHIISYHIISYIISYHIILWYRIVSYRIVSHLCFFNWNESANIAVCFVAFQCPIEWFHYGCVGLNDAPKGKWFCPQCQNQMKQQRRGGRHK